MKRMTIIIGMMMMVILPMVIADYEGMPRGRFFSSNNSRLPYISVSQGEVLTTIGNPLSDNYFEIARWDNDTYFRLWLPTSDHITLENGIVLINWSMFNGRMYMKDNDTFEWEGIFLSRPPAQLTEISFGINISGMSAEYQGRLDDEYNNYTHCNATDCWNASGNNIAHRPENVVGSYAFYSTSKKNNEYAIGKVFHLYKPLLIDANNITMPVEINIINNQLVMTIPINWMRRDATYPVILDPEFGYKKIGASNTAQGAVFGFIGNYSWNATGGETITSYNLYGESDDANPTQVSMTFYNVSMAHTHYLNYVMFNTTTSLTLPATATYVGVTANGTAQILNTSSGEGRYNYSLAVREDINTVRLYYDMGSGNTVATGQTAAAAPFQNPFAMTSPSAARVTMYVNYTTGSPPVIPDVNCSCPVWNSNWEINMTGNCLINQTCDIGKGNLTIVDTGTLTTNYSVFIIFNQLKTNIQNGQNIYIKQNGGIITNKTT